MAIALQSTAPVGINYDALKAWARTKLGAPILQVELDLDVTDGMWQSCLDDTLLFYTRFKPKVVGGILNVASSYHKYPLPPGVTGILRWSMQPNIPQFQDIEFSILYRSPQTYLYDVQDLAWWMSHLRMVSRAFGFEPEVHFETMNDGTDLNPIWNSYLFVNQVPQGTSSLYFLATYMQSYNSIPKNDYDWIRQIFLAYAKLLVGRIRSKYSSVPSANQQGTVQLDGERLLEEGQKTLDEMEIRLNATMDRFLAPLYG